MEDVAKEKLNITKDEAQELLWTTNHPQYKVILDDVVGNSRWSIHHSIIIMRLSDGKFFKDSYKVGATEAQYEDPWEYNEPNFTEVRPISKTVVVFE